MGPFIGWIGNSRCRSVSRSACCRPGRRDPTSKNPCRRQRDRQRTMPSHCRTAARRRGSRGPANHLRGRIKQSDRNFLATRRVFVSTTEPVFAMRFSTYNHSPPGLHRESAGPALSRRMRRACRRGATRYDGAPCRWRRAHQPDPSERGDIETFAGRSNTRAVGWASDAAMASGFGTGPPAFRPSGRSLTALRSKRRGSRD